MSLITRMFAAMGRPRNIEGELTVVGDDIIASMIPSGKGGLYFMPVDEIVKRQGWRTYKDMLNDDQVKASLAFKKVLVAGRAWEIKPGDESDVAKQVADFVTWNFTEHMDINRSLRGALTALENGFSIGELLWTRTDYQGSQMVVLDNIKHRDPKNFYLKIDTHGNVLGAQQQARGAIIELPPEKFWLYSHGGLFGNPYGVSDLRAAYRPWWAKKFIVNFWNVYLERMGSPLTMASYPQGAPEDLKNAIKSILSNLSSKTEILVPEGVKIELVEAKRSGSPDYQASLDFHNNAIARAILMVAMEGLSTGQAREGQGSQSELHARVMFKMADEISQALVCSLMSQVTKRLIDMNFDNPVYPEFVWQDYGEFQGTVVADEIRQLHAAGVVDLDQLDVNYLRSILGLQVRDGEDKPDEVIRPLPLPPPGNANAPPPAAPQNNDRAAKGPASKQPYTTDEVLQRLFGELQDFDL